MDASNRSYHVYRKTQSGKSALGMARGALAPAARQLLILIDGRRTLGDLASMVGAEALERSLAQLQAQGHVELVRHFPEGEDRKEDRKPVAAPLRAEAPAERTSAAPRRRSAAPVLLGLLLVAIAGGGWALVRADVDWVNLDFAVGSAARPAPRTVAGNRGSAAPPLKTPKALPPRAEAKTGAAARQAARLKPEAVAAAAPSEAPSAAPSEAPPAAANPAPLLHVRSQVPPQFPQQAKDLGIKVGRVVVILHVNPDGTVGRVERVSATPPQVYDEEMQRTFEKWTFDPPGVAGRMTVQVDVVPQNEIDASSKAGPASDDR